MPAGLTSAAQLNEDEGQVLALVDQPEVYDPKDLPSTDGAGMLYEVTVNSRRSMNEQRRHASGCSGHFELIATGIALARRG